MLPTPGNIAYLQKIPLQLATEHQPHSASLPRPKREPSFGEDRPCNHEISMLPTELQYITRKMNQKNYTVIMRRTKSVVREPEEWGTRIWSTSAH